jgi:hypothetical protein
MDSEAKDACIVKKRLLAELAATVKWIAIVEQTDRHGELAQALNRRSDLLRQIREHETEHQCW